MQETQVSSLGQEDPLEKGMNANANANGQRSLEGYNPHWCRKESDMTEPFTLFSYYMLIGQIVICN